MFKTFMARRSEGLHMSKGTQKPKQKQEIFVDFFLDTLRGFLVGVLVYFNIQIMIEIFSQFAINMSLKEIYISDLGPYTVKKSRSFEENFPSFLKILPCQEFLIEPTICVVKAFQ